MLPELETDSVKIVIHNANILDGSGTHFPVVIERDPRLIRRQRDLCLDGEEDALSEHNSTDNDEDFSLYAASRGRKRDKGDQEDAAVNIRLKRSRMNIS